MTREKMTHEECVRMLELLTMLLRSYERRVRIREILTRDQRATDDSEER